MATAVARVGMVKALPGIPYPLDAAFDGSGTNFAVFSEVAERIELCLFDDDGKETRVNMGERDGHNWHVYLTGVGPGQQYGYRVHGPWDPKRGIRCCPNKLLLDPNCKAVSGAIQWSDAVFPYRTDKPDAAACSSSDDARLMMKCVVSNPYFDWSNEHHPRTPLEDTIIYELHVRGFTKLHPALPPELRGTYAGVAHPAVIDYLKALGITAVELMPVHQFVHDRMLIDKGLRNYWGYNSICYFAPHNEYSSTGDRGQQVQEFKEMVYNLHEAGIEIILDVVYNHTAEGNHQDPVISQVKLIAEPWDAGEGGYQVGRFPVNWSEWNGIYRDTMRDFWRGQDSTLGAFAGKFTGSSDLYENTGRKPRASINFVTAHDGFSLHDPVTYEQKHNEANLEDGKDATDDNRSCNYGVEGKTDDPAINDLRARQVRNFLTTLLLSQGVPMIYGGDEIGRTKRGNNNAYCQDNEISWYDWEHADRGLLEFAIKLIHLRRDHPVFHRRGWYQGRSIRGSPALDDIGWFRPDGSGMTGEDWQKGYIKMVQIFLNGDLGYVDRRGEPVRDDDFLLLFNAHHEDTFFRLALLDEKHPWEIVLNTSTRIENGKEGEKPSGPASVKAEGRSVVVLTRPCNPCGPTGLKTLVNAIHRQGMSAILDVVYNHMGPEGSYLRDFGPYFTGRYRRHGNTKKRTPGLPMGRIGHASHNRGGGKSEIRNPKSETNQNDQKSGKIPNGPSAQRQRLGHWNLVL